MIDGDVKIVSLTEQISLIAKETVEDFIIETIEPYCSEVAEIKISKEELKKIILKNYDIPKPKYCDRNICIKNEYNGIECDECEVTKNQEFCEDCISRKAVLNLTKELRFDSVKGMEDYCYRCIDPYDVEDLPSVQPTTKENLVVEDCISRQAVLDLCDMQNRYEIPYEYNDGDKHIKGYDEGRIINVTKLKVLPPVTPKPKTGHWKFIQRGKFIDICCSECGYVSVKDYAYNYTIDQLDEQEKKDFFAESHMNFCECCGAKMESEE